MKRSWLSLPLLLILILALGLRLPLLNGSFWLDEAAQALESVRPLSQQLNILPDFQPPLLHYIVHFASYFSVNEWWLRLIGGLIPGLITIAASYEIARRILGKSAAVIVGLCLATSSLHIFYSQELRPYSLAAMFAALSWLCLIPTAEKSRQHFGWRNWWLWGALSLGGLFSTYVYPFLFLSQILYVIVFERKQFKELICVGATIVLLYIPWLPTFQQQLLTGNLLRQTLPGWQDVVSFSQFKSIPLVLGKFLFGVLDLSFSFFYIVSGVILGSLIAVCGWQLPLIQTLVKSKWSEVQKNRALWLILIWLIIPLLTAWIVSFWVPLIQPKRVLFLLPAVYLLLAWVVEKSKARIWSMTLVVLILAINLISTQQYFAQVKYQRENWRQLHDTIVSHYPVNQTTVIFAFPEPFAPWRWYDQNQYKTMSLGYLNNVDPTIVDQDLKPVTNSNYLIIFDYLRDLSDPDHKLLQSIESFGYTPVEVIDTPNVGFTRVYIRPGVTVSKV